jgi:Mce-associated membrane protein
VTDTPKGETAEDQVAVTVDEEPGEKTTTDDSDTRSDNDTAIEAADAADVADESADPGDESIKRDEAAKPRRKVNWRRVSAFALLPALAFLLALSAAFLKFQDSAVRQGDQARTESVQAAMDSTVALLSYKPDSVEQQLTGARDRLTGEFRDQYTDLINNVVIPGAKQKQISAVAKVPAAASVSANPGRAVVLVFVNQTVNVGNDAPTDTASSVRITLDKVGDRWLISKFEPV